MKPKPIDILILGGGFGAVYAFLRLHRSHARLRNTRIRIINRENYFLFTPLLHEVATGSVAQDNIIYNIRSLLGCCLADFIAATVISVNLDSRQVETSKGTFPYDILIYALGAETDFYGLDDESRRHVLPLKRLDDARQLKNRVIDVFENGEAPSFVVAGGGPTGVELAAELKEFVDDLARLHPRHPRPKVTLIHAGARLLPTFHHTLGLEAQKVLERRGLDIRLGEKISKVEYGHVFCESGTVVPASVVAWTAGVRAVPVPFKPEQPRDKKYRLAVNGHLSLADYPEVFVIGDAAGFRQVPMTAQAAEAMARTAADNAIQLLRHEPLYTFHYRHRGDLFSLGQWMAGAELYKVRFFGHLAWWVWRTIYLFKLVGWRNRLKVAIDWTISLFWPRDLNRY